MAKNRTIRERLRSSVDVMLIREGAEKVWRCKVHLHCISRSEAVGLLQGLVADMQAEVEGEAIKAARDPDRTRTDRREAA